MKKIIDKINKENRNDFKIIILLISIIIVMAIPILIAFVIKIKLFKDLQNNNDWIGFYANYIGSIIGVIGVYYVTRYDRIKREKENNDRLFFQHIQLYKKIVKALEKNDLDKLKYELNKLKNEEEWKTIDINTKNKIAYIIKSIYDYNNDYLYKIIYNFVKNNFYNELEILRKIGDSQTGEYFKEETVLPEHIKQLAIIIHNNIKDHDLNFEHTIIFEKKEKFIKDFKSKDMQNLLESSDKIYKKIINLENSEEIKEFIKNRKLLEEKIKNLKKQIESRINEVLHY